MTRAPAYPIWSSFAPRPNGGSLQDQLSGFLRQAVIAGALAPGARLPASRVLAEELDLSRNTVTLAYDRLVAEGFFIPQPGSGTYVNRQLPPRRVATERAAPARLARRLRELAALPLPPGGNAAQPLTPGIPDLGLFPHTVWARLQARFWRTRPALGYAEAAGLTALREAIAGYIGAARGVSCNAEQIIITAGAQGAMISIALALADPGAQVWVEHPGYAQTQQALLLAGLRPIPVAVDSDGLSVSAGRQAAPGARLAIVTPSHQYPLGVTMSLERRLALLAWAQDADAWVVEDDYDGEYRYDTSAVPVQALKSLDRDERVIYVGTLSKLLAPGLRLGFMIVPDALIEPLTALRLATDHGIATPVQAVCAEFIGSGHLGAHIRKTRTLYLARRNALLAALATVANDSYITAVSGAAAGLHVTAYLAPGRNDQTLAARARARGIGVKALTHYAALAAPAVAPGVLLGFANAPPEQIREAVHILAKLNR